MTDDTREDERKTSFWLDLIARSGKAMDDWDTACDRIDRAYASLSQLRNTTRDREFQLFWSNIQIIGPSIYARPPIPVVTPKFKDRRPLYRTASEFIERNCIVSLDLADIDQVMLEIRDDLSISGRGVAWARYEDDEDGERVCYEHVDRKDFAHDPARKWSEVDWVARRGWLTKAEMKDRFGEVADQVSYGAIQPRDDRGRYLARGQEGKCGVWEIWCKSRNKVIWVTDGAEDVLESAAPHLKLSGFFPCPKPAFGTLQRRSLIPVPDMLYYKDQLDEVNDLTRRIHALSEAIRVRGFYTGGGDVGEALERAMSLVDDGQVLIAVPGLQQLMQGSGDPIMWMPLEMVAQTITGLIDLRRQVIEDVYQIMGMPDIARGVVDADEKLGQSQLKQQNGSFRVRDKQNEMIRVARDLVRIGAEIMADEFSRETLVEAAQMEMPTDADIKRHVAELRQRMEADTAALEQQAPQPDSPEAAQQMQELQQQIEAVASQYAAQIKGLTEKVTVEQVMDFIKDEKLRPYVLDIETDSTIYPDEAAEKANRSEFMTAFAGTMQMLMPAMSMGEEAVAVAGGVFKFALAPYRVGRELEGLIDDFVDKGPEIAKRMQEQQQQGGEDQGLAAAQMKLAEAEVQKAQAAIAKVQADTQKSQMELQLRQAEAQAKAQADQQRIGLELEQTRGNISETEARIRKVEAEIQKMGVDASNQTRTQEREDVKAAADIQMRGADQAMAAQDRQRAVVDSERSAARADRAEYRADRQQDFAEKGSIK